MDQYSVTFTSHMCVCVCVCVQVMIVLEMLPNGDLREFLLSLKSQ